MNLFRICFRLLLVSAVSQTTLSVADDVPPPIQVPDGFRVTHFADDEVAHDIYSLTFNPAGQVVVSGPGYIRTLIDADNDGVADRFTTFAHAPKTGAMGLCFAGPHLLASGDDGVLLFRDEDQDGRADGPPQTVLKIKAGGEHHVHAIRRGPDGWWYVIAGNSSGVDNQYAELDTSPIRDPQAGVLLRLKPDLSAGEVVADGFRNAYDFDFNPLGDVFTFDSDGERDVSLPWYRPCRVFHVRPAFHAGWVSRSWKRPQEFFDMQPVVAAFGRGSPTGVVCYRHQQFPGRYEGALFVLDWTFGRIMALTLAEQNGLWKANSAVFAKGAGKFGFAPTDAAVAPDGSLFVSVGGRGSRGSVYRISYEPNADAATVADQQSEPPAGVSAVLKASQPQSAWSRAQWVPIADQLGQQPFVDAAANQLLPPADRIRAIEVLTERFGGLSAELASTLLQSADETVRARTIWAIGRRQPARPPTESIRTALQDSSVLVRRFALEALVSVTDAQHLESLLPAFAAALHASSKTVRSAAARVIGRLSDQQVQRLMRLLQDRPAGLLALGQGLAARSEKIQPTALSIATAALQESSPSGQRLLPALRLLQLSLGDLGPQPDQPAVLDGYQPRGHLETVEAKLPQVRRTLEILLPSGDAAVDRELIRSLAMVGSASSGLLDRLLDQTTRQTSPAHDIHRLIGLTQITAPRTETQTRRTAAVLIDLEAKVDRQQRKIDSNWDDRLRELYDLLIRRDRQLPTAVALQSEFGRPGHVMFVDRIPAKQTQTAIDSIVRMAAHDDDYRWTAATINLLARSQNPDHRQDLRALANDSTLLDAIVPVLAQEPRASDRDRFLEALDSPSLQVVKTSVSALRKLPRSNQPDEQFQLLSVAWRLHNNAAEYELREAIVRLLQNNMSQSFGFEFGKAGHRSQSEALQRWRSWLEQKFPQYRGPHIVPREAQDVLNALDSVDWQAGRVESGRQLFVRLSCSRCHSGRKALGPDLGGVTKRFSRRDLFISIVEPNRDIPNRYQMTTIVTSDGRSYSGLIVYESVDGLILRDVDHRTYRIEADEIEVRVRKRVSLMPAGLLKNVDDQDLANLYAFLQSL